MKITLFPFSIEVQKGRLAEIQVAVERLLPILIVIIASVVSVAMFRMYYNNHLGLAYNDSRSHLDIGRRVVEGLKPGLAQLGSVWLPLPHILMVPTIWNDFFWHSGLSGAIQSMLSFVFTCYLIYRILGKLGVGTEGRVFGALVFALNLNILYLQSTAMTELLLIATMTAAVYELINFHESESILAIVKTSIWVMLSTLIRYDGWFLFFVSALLIVVHVLRHKDTIGKKLQKAEGMFILFCTLSGFGIFLWLLWNAAIFKDPLYFAFGPYSAHAQQDQLDKAGVLLTKKNWWLSLSTYWYAMVYNTGAFQVILGILSGSVLFLDKKIPSKLRLAAAALLAPFFFNILALYLGHSVLFVQNINGDTWFNVRYGVMMIPSFAIFLGYIVDRFKSYKYYLMGILIFISVFSLLNRDAVTIDDGRVGSSQKNVTEVASWLEKNAKKTPGFILISAASHDAIIFSSNLPMKKFIHEGTGAYWTSATESPDRWARWIVMRTNDENDQTFRLVNKTGALWKYQLVDSYPFADIYQLKDDYLDILQTEAVLPKQR